MNDSNITSPQQIVISIGRTFGSGGRILGQKLAARLHIGYYDKELLVESARRAGVSPEFFERNDERFPSFLNGMFSFSMGYSPLSYYAGATSISDDSLYRAQSDFIRHLADSGSCVIVGRTSDYVLRDFPGLVSIFVHAPMNVCVDRIVTRQPELTREKARKLAERVNKLRANYYSFYTDRTWGAASSYDMCFDTSLMDMDALVEVIVDYISRRFPNHS
ncbi:MAG: cytidylate kinase-like family protein [Bacteroides sp.]|nr:cytidylate kinase-like family protein [Barnesiella sp.]MBD5315020.1 cytidylate kinase-like family protein [Bacteroides sp.]MDE7449904.1 cytidylate kinase-like family protein [Paramuribaculum sp.]